MCDMTQSYVRHDSHVYLQDNSFIYEWDVETCGAGVDIHTIDTRPSFCQFRTHFLVRFVPNKWPLLRAHEMVLNGCVIRKPCTSNAVTDAYVQRSLDFLFLSFFDSGTKIFLFSGVSTPAPLSTPVSRCLDCHVYLQNSPWRTYQWVITLDKSSRKIRGGYD